MRRPLALAAAALVFALTASVLAQRSAAPVQTPRIYIFENGFIKGLSVKLFNFAPEEIKQPNLVNISYLVVHPKGTLQFDAGAVADSHFKPGAGPVVEGIMSAEKPLLPQLAAAGYRPGDVTHFAMSHYHSDHTAN